MTASTRKPAAPARLCHKPRTAFKAGSKLEWTEDRVQRDETHLPPNRELRGRRWSNRLLCFITPRDKFLNSKIVERPLDAGGYSVSGREIVFGMARRTKRTVTLPIIGVNCPTVYYYFELFMTRMFCLPLNERNSEDRTRDRRKLRIIR